MRSLKNKPQVIAPTSTYPYGRIKDDDGSGTVGTPVDEQVYGDFHQFFSQLMVDGGLTPNEIAENEYDGFQLNQALAVFIQRISGNGLWQTLSSGNYGTNWGSFNLQPHAYQYSDLNRSVRFKGVIQNSTSAPTSGDTLFTLPTGYRPIIERNPSVIIQVFGISTYAELHPAILNISPSGVVKISYTGALTSGVTWYISFDNVEFVL